MFNASPEIVGQDDLSGIQLFQFTSNNENYSYIDFTTDSPSSASIKYGDNTIAYKLSGWINTAYRTINITTPFYRNTNPTFYDWFVANAVKQEPVGGYGNLSRAVKLI